MSLWDAKAGTPSRFGRPAWDYALTGGGLIGVGLHAFHLQQSNELLDCDAGLSDQRSQRTLGDRPMVRNYKATVGWVTTPKNDVTAALPIALVPELLERSNDLAGGDARKLAQTATSTSSSLMLGGIGSPCSLRLSR